MLEQRLQRFTELLDKQDYTRASELTSYPSAASATLKQMFAGLQPGKVDYRKTQFIGLDSESAIFSMDADWNFDECDCKPVYGRRAGEIDDNLSGEACAEKKQSFADPDEDLNKRINSQVEKTISDILSEAINIAPLI